MSRVFYLVSRSEESGIAAARARGWTRIAARRFATPENDDVRLVCRLSELVPIPGGTMMLRDGEDYDPGFDKFVAEGGGVWVE